jgi:hypothetical protein
MRFANLDSACGNAAETEDSGDQRDNKKHDRVVPVITGCL